MSHKIRAEASARRSSRWTIMTGLRVVQWATGNIGSRSLRHIIQHPDLTLAGVYVTSTAKAGREARTVRPAADRRDGHQRRRRDPRARRGLRLYMPAECDLDQVCAILGAGTNIVTTRGEFLHPGSMSPTEGTGRAGLRRRRRLHSRHRLEPRVHLPGASPGADVDSAASRRRRSTNTPTCSAATHRRCCSTSWASMTRPTSSRRRSSPTAPTCSARHATGGRSAWPADRLGHLDRGGGGHAGEAHHRRRHAGCGHGSRPADDRHRHQGLQAPMTFTATWYCTANLARLDRPRERLAHPGRG